MKITGTRFAAAALAAALAVPNAQAQVPASVSTPDKVESRLGTLVFKDGVADPPPLRSSSTSSTTYTPWRRSSTAMRPSTSSRFARDSSPRGSTTTMSLRLRG